MASSLRSSLGRLPYFTAVETQVQRGEVTGLVRTFSPELCTESEHGGEQGSDKKNWKRR